MSLALENTPMGSWEEPSIEIGRWSQTQTPASPYIAFSNSGQSNKTFWLLLVFEIGAQTLLLPP
jgi:hypothetical protein